MNKRQAIARAAVALREMDRRRRQGPWWYEKRRRLFARTERGIEKLVIRYAVNRALSSPYFQRIIAGLKDGTITIEQLERIVAADSAKGLPFIEADPESRIFKL